MELSHSEYASAIIMPMKKDVHDNYTDRQIRGDYRSINWQTKFNKYAMPILEKIFDVIEYARIFSTFNLWAGYHQLPIREKDKAKTTFWSVNSHGKDYLYQ